MLANLATGQFLILKDSVQNLHCNECDLTGAKYNNLFKTHKNKHVITD